MPSSPAVLALLAWYEQNARPLPWRATQDPYCIWVSEIMLQQTRVAAVVNYYQRFLQAFPTLAALAIAPEDILLKQWEGLGYYSRAKNLQRAARVVMAQHGGVLPRDPKQLLALPGIGQYTAGAIASQAFAVPVPAVDGNVLRVLARRNADPSDITQEATKRAIAARLLPEIPQDAPGAFNQALMELGACVCLPKKPKCVLCPWVSFCVAFATHSVQEYPFKSPKKPRRKEERSLLLLHCGNTCALQKRPPKGLLAGLWELPQRFAVAEELIVARQDAGQAVHVFSHVEWHMHAEALWLRQPCPGDLAWVTANDLQHRFALPSAFAAFKTKMFLPPPNSHCNG